MERLIQAVQKSFQWETLWLRTWGRHMRRWDNLCAEISNKENNSAEEIKGRSRIEELIIRLWCFLCMYGCHLWVHERQIVGLEALWAAGIFPSLISQTHTYKETQCEAKRLFSQQTSPFVYVQPGVILDAFWRGFFLVKRLMKELTITLAECYQVMKYEFMLFAVLRLEKRNQQRQKEGDISPLATVSLLFFLTPGVEWRKWASQQIFVEFHTEGMTSCKDS